MSQQQFPLEQDAGLFWIHVQSTNGDVVTQAEEYYDQYQWLPSPQSPYSYGVDFGVGYIQDPQYYTSFSTADFTNATRHSPQLHAYHQPLAALFPDPPPSSPIPTPDSHGPSAESSPSPSSGTSASTPSSVGTVSPDVCRQAWPLFNEEAQQWSCGGCNKTFSDKYGTERHIATVGLKVTCRYCGSQISTLESSRRRHLRRETCKKEGTRRGFTTRSEEGAFLEGV